MLLSIKVWDLAQQMVLSSYRGECTFSLVLALAVFFLFSPWSLWTLDIRGSSSLPFCLIVFFQNYSQAPISIRCLFLISLFPGMASPSSWPHETPALSPFPPLLLPHYQWVPEFFGVFFHLVSDFPFHFWCSLLLSGFTPHRWWHWPHLSICSPSSVVVCVACGLISHFLVMAFKPFCQSPFKHTALIKTNHSRSLTFSKNKPWDLWISNFWIFTSIKFLFFWWKPSLSINVTFFFSNSFSLIVVAADFILGAILHDDNAWSINVCVAKRCRCWVMTWFSQWLNAIPCQF